MKETIYEMAKKDYYQILSKRLISEKASLAQPRFPKKPTYREIQEWKALQDVVDSMGLSIQRYSDARKELTDSEREEIIKKRGSEPHGLTIVIVNPKMFRNEVRKRRIAEFIKQDVE